MSFTFDPYHMEADIRALTDSASTFLARHTRSRVDRLLADLRNAIANASKGGGADFSWGCAQGQPIVIEASRWWKGETEDFDRMEADIHLDYSCRYIDSDRRVLVNGVAVLKIRSVNSGHEKVVHFDAEEGGWTEEVDGRQRGRAGHPPFHAQFHGAVNDIPRTPSLIVHPVDVINFGIIELHQKRWRKHLETTRAKSKVRKFPRRQRERLSAVLRTWDKTILSAGNDHALIAMQKPFGGPLAL